MVLAVPYLSIRIFRYFYVCLCIKSTSIENHPLILMNSCSGDRYNLWSVQETYEVPTMRLGIFSDVHANLEALRAVLSAFQQTQIDRYICLGDTVGYGANPNEC